MYPSRVFPPVFFFARHSGMVRRTNPESRDSGFDASHRPGMTVSGFPRFPVPKLVVCEVSGKSGPRADPAQQTRVSAVIKSSKDRRRAFPKRVHVGTYRSHPMASAKGSLLRKPPDRIDRRPRALARFVSVPFFEGAQRFIAGWSSPVARQAHNLKVIGSNPIPATKTNKPSENASCFRGLFAARVESPPSRGQV